MRPTLIMVTLLAAAACGSTAKQPTFHWVHADQPSLGITVDVDRGWKTTVVEDALLLTPTTDDDDFAIVVMSSATTSSAEVALSRLGQVDQLALSKLPIASNQAARVDDLRGGTGVFHANGKPIVVRVARVTGTYVAAVIAKGSTRRGTAAFEHVVQSLVTAKTGAHAKPEYPEWLRKGEEPRDEVDDRPRGHDEHDDDDDDDQDDSDDGDEP